VRGHSTGELAFLILDPHFPDKDDLAWIQRKVGFLHARSISFSRAHRDLHDANASRETRLRTERATSF
jgi:hypothetical protein